MLEDTTFASSRRVLSQQPEDIARNILRRFAYLFIALALLFTVVAYVADDVFFFRLATEALLYGGLAMGVDLLLGYAGLLSLGHALFFGLGAYVSALVLKSMAPSFWLAMVITILITTAVGVIAGLIAIRARGVYFALITFGLAEVVAKAVYNTYELGGSDGIMGVPIIEINFGFFAINSNDPGAFFLFVLAFIMGLYFILEALSRSPFGRVVVAIKANEDRVPFLGFSAQSYKLLIFVIAANVAALSGALYPVLRGFVSPELLFFHTSGNAVITVILGGIGTLIGPLYGSVILTALKSIVGSYTEHHLIVIGVLFMISVIFFPTGLIGYLKTRIQRRSERPGRAV